MPERTHNPPAWWFDAHLDLAYLAVCGRNLSLPLAALSGAAADPHPPAAVTLPSLADGRVRFALATIFTEPRGPDAATLDTFEYREGDAEGAHRRGRAQLEVYLTLAERGLMSIDLHSAFRTEPGTGVTRGGMGVAEFEPYPPDRAAAGLARQPGLHAGLLMENADPIREPGELGWWVQRGVCAIGLAWVRGSRYAQGNGADTNHGPGLTPLGRDLVKEIDRLGVLHDVSHLSDRALGELLDATPARVVASHSNCRALIARTDDPRNWQRHLTDASIREIARRGGVIGVNLFSPFLLRGSPQDQRAGVDDVVAHIQRVCEITGSHLHVGLGSDADGGFSAARLPTGIERPADLWRLADALRRAGWTGPQIEDFAWRNWCRMLSGRLPQG
ncbi:MAG: membrane dipeptidase [Phycisphaerales bacterium]|nr:membrane dipeptidase [Phycisphaerales bacterium]